MTAEFTGERVIPGKVDVDLWNEHFARYAFAVRLCRNRRVLDAGCGTGYGSAELSLNARRVTGIDLSGEALQFARENYRRSNLHWAQASTAALPFSGEAFDLVVAFEVIEHLRDWPSMLQEARRVLAPGGQFIVSTPNKHFYAETRSDSGPNPFHEHEFEYEEFRDSLLRIFPSVSLFVEDHTEGILFRPIAPHGGVDVRIDRDPRDPHDSNFFIAVCGLSTQTCAPPFLYIPSAANVLKERADHIDRLRGEIEQKDAWLKAAQSDHVELLKTHRDQKSELEKSNLWAQELNGKLAAAETRILELQQEVEQQQKAAIEVLAQYEARTEKTRLSLERQTAELARAVELLNKAELTVEERTRWALDLDAQREALERELNKVRASRWIRLGRAFGMGPEIHNT
jgi:SAM-dependent methyltransferase